MRKLVLGLLNGLSQILTGVRQAMERLGTAMSQWLNGISASLDGSSLPDCWTEAGFDKPTTTWKVIVHTNPPPVFDDISEQLDKLLAMTTQWKVPPHYVDHTGKTWLASSQPKPEVDPELVKHVQRGLDHWHYKHIAGREYALLDGEIADEIGEVAMDHMELILEMQVYVMGETKYHDERRSWL